MKIRSITYFANPGWPIQAAVLKKAGEFLAAARPGFESAGYEVDTTRLASIPFPKLLQECSAAALTNLAQALEAEASQAGFDYVSMGPALPDATNSYDAIPQALAATQNAFFAGLMTSTNGGVALTAVRACAGVIDDCAGVSADGFGNLRFAALANVAPGAPFFPAAYAGRELPAFAIASEAADLAVQAFSQAGSLQEAVEGRVGDALGVGGGAGHDRAVRYLAHLGGHRHRRVAGDPRGGHVVTGGEPADGQIRPLVREPVGQVVALLVGLGYHHDRLPGLGQCDRRPHDQGGLARAGW